MRCKNIVDLLALYVQGDLPDRHRKVVEQYLVFCARCSESAEFRRQLDSLTKSLFAEKLQEVSEADWDRVWQGIYAEITSQPALKPSLIRKLFLPVLQRRWLPRAKVILHQLAGSRGATSRPLGGLCVVGGDQMRNQ